MKVWNCLISLALVCALPGSSSSGRIVAIGDLHGDYENTVKALQMVNTIDGNLNWIGGNNTTLIQTGDVADRGPDCKKIYELIMRLVPEAISKGDLFVPILGNHEAMNMMENYKYVSEDDIKKFGSLEKRKKEFSKSGKIGQFLRSLDIATKQKDVIFVHGGITKNWSQYKVDGLNSQSSQYLINDTIEQLKQRDIFSQRADGPSWYRGYAQDTEPEICSKLDDALSLLGAKRMVMGHTIQNDYKITTRCGGKIILIDVAISKVYSGGHMAALEITDQWTRAVYPNNKYEYLEVPSN